MLLKFKAGGWPTFCLILANVGLLDGPSYSVSTDNVAEFSEILIEGGHLRVFSHSGRSDEAR